MAQQPASLWRDRLFSGGLVGTILAFLVCLGTHIITILGLAGAMAWLGHAEHVLLFLTLAFAVLTVYAWRRHRHGCKHGSGQCSDARDTVDG